MPRADMDHLLRFEVPMPPLPEQKEICAQLQTVIAAVERAGATAEVCLKAADALPGAYLRELLNQRALANFPLAPLSEESVLLPSRSISLTGDTPVRAITTACLSERGFLPTGIKEALMSGLDAADCKVGIGEVLVARSNTADLVGRVAMYGGEPPNVVASDLTIRIRPGPRLTPRFLATYLSFLFLTGYWKERAGGASGSMKKITREHIKALRVPIPPLEAQNLVSDRFCKAMIAFESLQAALEAEKAALEYLPPALLRRAFRGEF
jgi:type I restriction enzyme S subunit